MYCTNCGNKILSSEKFCINCGFQVLSNSDNEPTSQTTLEVTVSKKKDEKWYHRLGIVIYVLAHLPLLIVVPVVWSENAEYYSSYSKAYYGSDLESFWYSLLTIIIWVGVLRLIKMTVNYIVRGIKPKFKDLLHF